MCLYVCVWGGSFLGEENRWGTGMLVGYYGAVELHMRLLCQVVFVGEEAVKIGGDLAMEVRMPCI